MLSFYIIDAKSIREIIMKNANGEIIFTKSMRTTQKISNSDSSKHQEFQIVEGSDDYDTEGKDECGIGSSQVGKTITSLMSEYKRVNIPQHPHFSSKSKRLLSFIDWPLCMRQKPEDLADAGFFYTGHRDRTVCFHCGGGLKDWEDDDNPWQQHVQWFSQCAYVKLKSEFAL